MERFSVARRGIDARRKGAVVRVYAADLALRTPGLEESVCAGRPGVRVLGQVPDPFPRDPVPRPSPPPVVVGAGPAGLFAAWTLARSGAPPLLLERGRPVEERARQVAAFWTDGILDPESNPQFGEGGAGTFSDGKLTTRIGDPLADRVIRLFGEFAELPDLPVDAKPHVGTDRLRRFCRRMREELLARGAQVRFGARVDGLGIRDGAVGSVRLASGEEIPCDRVVFATGHSARDTLRMLLRAGVKLSAKPFAVGFRVEHPQGLIDSIQYGRAAGRHGLPPADYRLAARAPSGRAVYSFCMCPGGEVMAASSGPGEMPVNGMSSRARSSGFANSGIVASVSGREFGTGDVLGGIDLQARLEARAFRKGGQRYGIPASNLVTFLRGKTLSLGRGRALAPAVVRANLSGILPPPVEEDLRWGLERFCRVMRGFETQEATLYAVESRTSSPVRVERANWESVSVKGLYPVGEGAGHAGGIVSSAVDGIRAALRILEGYSMQKAG